jgi:hypothetical protein
VTGPEDLLRVAPECIGEPVPPSVGRRFAKSCALLGKAAVETPKNARKLSAKASRAFKQAGKAADKAGRRKKRRVSADCAAALKALFAAAQDEAHR